MMTDDHNFKNLLVDYSVQALEFFAPSEMKHIPPGARITPIREQQTKERLRYGNWLAITASIWISAV